MSKNKTWHLPSDLFDFLGGVPRRVVLDNLTTGVIKADLYDPRINRGYEEMANHYGVLIDPARAGKPKDKDYASYYTSFPLLVVTFFHLIFFLPLIGGLSPGGS